MVLPLTLILPLGGILASIPVVSRTFSLGWKSTEYTGSGFPSAMLPPCHNIWGVVTVQHLLDIFLLFEFWIRLLRSTFHLRNSAFLQCEVKLWEEVLRDGGTHSTQERLITNDQSTNDHCDWDHCGSRSFPNCFGSSSQDLLLFCSIPSQKEVPLLFPSVLVRMFTASNVTLLTTSLATMEVEGREFSGWQY